MESTIEKVGEITVVTVKQDSLDARSAKEFRDDLEGAITDEAKILLDMSNVEFVDSAGLGTIVATLKRLRASGGDLTICCVHKTVRALFELVRMHRLVEIYDTRDEALA
jgi:anti-sigma B factor antagonist